MACNCVSNMREKIDDHFFGNQLRMIKRFEREGEKVLLRYHDDHTKFLMKVILFFLSNTLNEKKEDQLNATTPITQSDSKNDETKNTSDSKSDAKNENSAEDHEKVEENRETKVEKNSICWAYRYNKCSHENGEGCPKRHPKKCQKFCDFGHIAKDKKGCDTKNCDLLHPKLCRNSTTARKCPYMNCRFQHLRGTEIVQEKGHRNARNVKESKMPENRVELLVENFSKVVELLMRFIPNSEVANNLNFKLTDR